MSPGAARRAGAGGLVGRVRDLIEQRSLRYLIAAGTNTLVGLAAYPLLLWSSAWLRVHYMVALVIAQMSCLCFAFATYKLGVFQTRGNILAEFAKFASFYMANYAANWVILPLLVEIAGIKPIIAQLGFSIALMIGSFFWHSRVTFRTRAAPGGPPPAA